MSLSCSLVVFALMSGSAHALSVICPSAVQDDALLLTVRPRSSQGQ